MIVVLSIHPLKTMYYLDVPKATQGDEVLVHLPPPKDVAVAATIDSPGFAEIPADERKPLNVLILYPDDWRHDTIGGVAPVVQTPFLNRLAERGIRFTHNMVTTSICWISRATLFTGQYASRHKSILLSGPEFYKTWHNSTWPALLRQAGYFTGHIGKWQYSNPKKTVQGFFDFAKIFEGRHRYNQKSAAEKARDMFFKFLMQKPDDKPFAITIAFYPPKAIGTSSEPGAQWNPKPQIRQQYYGNVTIPRPPYDVNASYNKLPWFFHSFTNAARKRWEERYQTDLQYQESMKNYYSLVTEVDDACREILEELQRRELLNDTMVIFTTDNGLFHSAHGLAGKWYPYQESIRVPLIVYDPRMSSHGIRTTNDALTLNIDLAATVLGAAGIEPPPGMQGRDIADLYLERAPEDPKSLGQNPWRTDFFYEFPVRQGTSMPTNTAVVRHDYKYIYWNKFHYEEIFNLTEDPFELNNQFHNASYQEILQQLRDRHAVLQEEVV
jgi:arylsulfatase A-like enzyme